jgi:hypothetical protein
MRASVLLASVSMVIGCATSYRPPDGLPEALAPLRLELVGAELPALGMALTGRVLAHREAAGGRLPVHELVFVPPLAPEGSPPSRLRYAMPDGVPLPVAAGDELRLKVWGPAPNALGSGAALVLRGADDEVLVAVEALGILSASGEPLPLRVQATGKPAFRESVRKEGGLCQSVLDHRMARVDLGALAAAEQREPRAMLAPGGKATVVNQGVSVEVTLVDCARVVQTTCENEETEVFAYLLRLAAPDAAPK